MRTLTIAEIGENHIGDMAMARKMIEAAAQAGADYAKFQSYRGKDVVDTDPEKDWFYKVELSNEAHQDLKKHAEAHHITFMSTPFTVERARFLCEELRLDQIKIASFSLTNWPLLRYVSQHAQVVFLSTGVASLEEIGQAVQILRAVPRVYLLHCVSEYPLTESNVNLRIIQTLKTLFNLPVGYSDHTTDIAAPVTAVAAGAEVIEKHFTLDKNLPGTDHILSATPLEFKQMVEQIRRIETLLGSPIKRLTEGEKANYTPLRTRFKESLEPTPVQKR